MQFNSIVFLLFGLVFFTLWPVFRVHRNRRWIYLVAASFIFYGWWDWRFIFLIIASGLIDFFAGLGMERFSRHKRLLLVLSIIGNIGSLAVFKYLDFGISNINWLLQNLGIGPPVPAANLILPVGISFYTFQSMSYTIDIYRGQLHPTRNIFHFFAYLSLFPQLVAGPIVRARDLLPQLESSNKIDEQQRWEGLKLIAFGFFKKVVVADTMAISVNAAFTAPTPTQSCSYWWVIMIMFAFQIYCDFSGYTDIARGLGKWMGYEFPLNFNNPYLSSNFKEYWQRWHISLSTWFRDYVYFSLGGSRKGKARWHTAMWMSMLLSGLWHGAAWTYIAWAAVHAFYMSVERVTQWPKKISALPGGRHLSTLTVFILAVLAYVFFRAQSIPQAIRILQIMFNPAIIDYEIVHSLVDNNALNVLGVMIASQLFFYFGWDKSSWALSTSKGMITLKCLFIAFLILSCVFMHAPSNTFIYFQF